MTISIRRKWVEQYVGGQRRGQWDFCVSRLMKEKHVLKPDGKDPGDPRWATDLILHNFLAWSQTRAPSPRKTKLLTVTERSSAKALGQKISKQG